MHFLAQIDFIKEPSNFSEANKYSVWIYAMKAEINALEENSTWSFTYVAVGKTFADYQWVFKVKLKSNGTLDRHKARLVAIPKLKAYIPLYFCASC